jgi:NAD(P)-dependent dehydrogenase (short-subunit alcohol dehydrogenase family)
MKDLAGKVAVVTGAASGIGRAMAERFAAEGMKVVLADVEDGALRQTAHELTARGATVLAARTDVSRADEVAALAERTRAAFGAVHVLCNNAGVGIGGMMWEHSLADWEWVLGVNLWGVIHGCRTFVPIMLEQGGEAHIVNTASMAGLVSTPLMSVYNVTKQGVVALSETLQHDLTLKGSAIKVSVLCPGFVATAIADADRNRPGKSEAAPAFAQMQPLVRAAVAAGIPAAQVAADVVDAIRADRFYVITHPAYLKQVRTRMDEILEQRPPTYTMPDPSKSR